MLLKPAFHFMSKYFNVTITAALTSKSLYFTSEKWKSILNGRTIFLVFGSSVLLKTHDFRIVLSSTTRYLMTAYLSFLVLEKALYHSVSFWTICVSLLSFKWNADFVIFNTYVLKFVYRLKSCKFTRIDVIPITSLEPSQHLHRKMNEQA